MIDKPRRVTAIPLLGKSIDVYHIVGTILIVIGVTLANRKARARDKDEAKVET